MAKHRLFDAKRSGKWFVRVGPKGHYLSWHGSMLVTVNSGGTPFVLDHVTATHFYPVS